jgi:DNA/RNA-binding domain of Phe-tRNA-synthetase-like protein
MDIRIELPGVKLGIIEADYVQVVLLDAGLAQLVDDLCKRKREEFTVETLAQAEPVRAVRSMFRAWGMDPSKYRPSSEALLRRVVQGRGLYRISNIVDVSNACSIETGWPYGLYDTSRIHPPITFRHGTRGESYERVGKEMWQVEGRPVLADSEGPFGAPISDSTRSMVTEASRGILIVIYAPATVVDKVLKDALACGAERLEKFGKAQVTRTRICEASSA